MLRGEKGWLRSRRLIENGKKSRERGQFGKKEGFGNGDGRVRFVVRSLFLFLEKGKERRMNSPPSSGKSVEGRSNEVEGASFDVKRFASPPGGRGRKGRGGERVSSFVFFYYRLLSLQKGVRTHQEQLVP